MWLFKNVSVAAVLFLSPAAAASFFKGFFPPSTLIRCSRAPPDLFFTPIHLLLPNVSHLFFSFSSFFSLPQGQSNLHPNLLYNLRIWGLLIKNTLLIKTFDPNCDGLFLVKLRKSNPEFSKKTFFKRVLTKVFSKTSSSWGFIKDKLLQGSLPYGTKIELGVVN